MDYGRKQWTTPTAAATLEAVGFLPSSLTVFFFLMWLHEVFTAMHRFPLVAIKQGLLTAVASHCRAQPPAVAACGLSSCGM